MFRTFAIHQRGARAAAAGALIVALSATGLGGAVTASPSSEDGKGCSVLAHERNAGRHRLHTAWQDFRIELQALSREARTAQRSLGKAEAGTLLADARSEVESARKELDAIRHGAHLEIQELAELGTACKEPAPADDSQPTITLVTVLDPDAKAGESVRLLVQFSEKVECAANCEDAFTYDANGADDPAGATAGSVTFADDGMSAELLFTANADVDGSKDTLTFDAASATFEDEDGNAMVDESEDPVELSLTTNDLVAKYRDVVDQAIKDMQAVVDGVNADVSELLAAAEEGDLSRASEPAKDRQKEKAKDQDNDKQRGKPDVAGNRGKGNRK